MGQALFLKAILMRDSDLTSFLETEKWNGKKQKDAKMERIRKGQLISLSLS